MQAFQVPLQELWVFLEVYHGADRNWRKGKKTRCAGGVRERELSTVGVGGNPIVLSVSSWQAIERERHLHLIEVIRVITPQYISALCKHISTSNRSQKLTRSSKLCTNLFKLELWRGMMFCWRMFFWVYVPWRIEICRMCSSKPSLERLSHCAYTFKRGISPSNTWSIISGDSLWASILCTCHMTLGDKDKQEIMLT